MDTSYVEVLRKMDTPIIVITEDSDGEYDAEEEFDSDAEIVELEKKRGVSVQKDVIDEEAEDENKSEKKCLEENKPELENAEQNVDMEKEADEGAAENEAINTEQVNVKENSNENETIDSAEAEPEKEDVNSGEEKEEGSAEAAKKSTGQEQNIDSSNEPVENLQIKKDKPVEKTEEAEIKVPAKIDRELLETLVSLHGGWHDNELKKNIKQTPKGWQLISV